MSDRTIIEDLRKVQLELKAPKSQFNSFSNFYYRNAEDILEAVKPLLDKHNLTLTITDALENVGDRYYVKAICKVANLTDEVTTEAYAREEETKKGMDAAQITGSASSYARKYALNGMFNIDDTKDADNHDNTGAKKTADKPTVKPAYANPTAPASEKQRDFIAKKLAEQGVTMENTPGYLIEQYGVTIPLTKEGAGFVIDELIGVKQ